MTVRENEFGVSMSGQESKKKPGTYYFDGAARVIKSAMADGLTNVSIYIGQYGPSIQLSKPFKKDTPAD